MPVRRPRPRLCALAAAILAPAFAVMSVAPGASADDGHAGSSGGQASPLAELRSELVDADVATLAAKAGEIQERFVESALAYDQAKVAAQQADDYAAEKESDAAAVRDEAEAAREALAGDIVEVYEEGIGSQSALLQAMTRSPGDMVEAAQMSVVGEMYLDVQSENADELVRTLERARILAEDATAARELADRRETEAKAMLEDIQAQAELIADAADEAVASADAVAQAQQEARNKAALREWRRYLRTLHSAHVTPPTAQQLLDPANLPRRFSPVTAAEPETTAEPKTEKKRGSVASRGPGREATVPGVVSTRTPRGPITVLPEETIETITEAFDELGTPYAKGAVGPTEYDCGGYTSALWARQDVDLAPDPAEQLARNREVPTSQVQVGDLVFSGADTTGLQHVGIYLGGNMMLAADGAATEVAVVPAPEPVAAVRVTLPAGPKDNEAEDATDVHCGLPTATGSTSGGFVSPVAEGLFQFTGTYGEPGPRWSKGYHTGLDFAAPSGTPVYAAAGGVVTRRSDQAWAGPNFVSIDHGNGLVTWYAHMEHAEVETGDRVEAGQLIGQVGAYGNTTGPHLHFEVHVNGPDVDPMPFLLGGSATGASAGWGGNANGMIPSSQLCSLGSASSHLLRCDAARAFDTMSAAYAKRFGAPICITDSYRSYAAQVSLYARKPTLAAVPGTSNHGWALAVDLCGGIESFSSVQHEWLDQHASQFGWVHPSWAEPGGSKPEPWHWEYGLIS